MLIVDLPTGICMHYVEAVPVDVKVKGYVIMVHGYPDSWYGWRHQIQSVCDTGYHVIVPDNRGYGETTPIFREKELYSMEVLCKVKIHYG